MLEMTRPEKTPAPRNMMFGLHGYLTLSVSDG